MRNSKEYTDLLHRKQEIIQAHDKYMAERSDAKKYFEEIDFSQDDKTLEQMCHSIYEDGMQGDKKLLDLLLEARELMNKQEKTIGQLEKEMDLEYQAKTKKCEDELTEIQRQLRLFDLWIKNIF